MKSIRLTLSILLIALTTAALAQSDKPKPAPTEAQKSFDKVKSLAGNWEAHLTTIPPTPEVEGKLAQISMRVTSRGNALVHEMDIAGQPDHPVTMFYLEDDRLTLTHYCDAGNRPRMTGKMSPDGKTLDFEFLDISGDMKYHMHHSTFTIIDANHHIEDWTFMMGDKPIRAHFDLQRKN